VGCEEATSGLARNMGKLRRNPIRMTATSDLLSLLKQDRSRS